MIRRWMSCMFLLTLGVTAACAPAAPPSPTADLTAEARNTDQVRTQDAQEALETQAQATDSAATDAAETAIASKTQAYVERQSADATSTARSIAEATQSAQPMAEIIEGLYTDGYISRNTGVYTRLPPFDAEWPQINWYQFWYTDYSPSDFVLRADASWDSASDRANWNSSGCGFVFRAKDVDNHYVAFLGLDGWVYFGRSLRGAPSMLGRGYYGKVGIPNGNAELMLAVDGSNISFFVNGKKVHSRQDSSMTSGWLAYTLMSGTNKDFGTRCRMTNVDLWELE